MSKSASTRHGDLPHPAATVLVLRDSDARPEVFMVRRHERTAFMGGAYVFPGGRVDPADRDIADDDWCDGLRVAETQLRDLPAADAAAFHVAAIRELFEEAGVLLARDADRRLVSLAGPETHARFKQHRTDVHAGTLALRDLVEHEGLRLALDALVVFAHWVTPPVDTRRFDTRFFLTRLPPDQTPAHDDTETTHGTWTTAAAALAQAERGEIVLPPPTWTTLRELEAFGSVADALAWAGRRRVVRREPLFVEQVDRQLLVLPGDPLSPEQWLEPPPRETRFVLVNGRWRAERAAT